MGDKSKIEWTDATWNPVVGCTKVSEGCRNCYAYSLHDMRHKAYSDGKKLPKQYALPFKEVQVFSDRLDMPLRWKKPRKIFVNSLSDLFHDDVPDDFISKVWDVMWACPQHTFQILTKRPERMMKWVNENAYMMDFGWTPEERQPMTYGMETHIDTLFDRNRCGWANGNAEVNNGYGCDHPNQDDSEEGQGRCFSSSCPIACSKDDDSDLMILHSRPRYAFAQNVWLGTSVENKNVLNRVDDLRKTPAAIRFLSIEPLLGDLGVIDLTGIGWVIVGGESGTNARPMHPDWASSLRVQCQAAGVPFFFKQWGEHLYHSAVWKQNREEYGRMTSLFSEAFIKGKQFPAYSPHGAESLYRVGKHNAGRMLDGREWNEFPL
jgi:protein gp37